MLEARSRRHIEAVEKRPPDLQVAHVEMRHIGVHRALDERDGRALDQEVLAPHLFLEHAERLRQRVAREMRRGVTPQQVHQIVAREAPPRLDREPDQQREVLARAELDLLARPGQKQRGAERQQVQVRRQTDGSQRFGTVQ